jgi:hypothetical protein
MSLYWSADDSVKVGETKISIPSENGLNYSPGQKVQIFVDPSTEFMDGRETYLEFNVKLGLPAGKAPTRLQLDKVGGSILIRNIRIYDGSRGNLLEEVNAYDTYVACKYDYDKDRNAENMRALKEGASVYQPGNRGDSGTTQSAMANTLTNPYFKQTIGDQSASFSDSDFLTAKVCIPIHTGIFANSDTIFPVMMTNGLYMEIDLNDGPAVIKQLDSVLLDRQIPLNPVFHSLNGSSAPDSWSNGSAATKFYVDTDNSISGQYRVSKFPFVVGETINFARTNNNGSLSVLSATATISQINSSTSASGGTGLVEVVLDASVTNNGVAIDQNWALYSTAVSSQSSYDATYTVSNVNLVVSQIQLDPAYKQGMLQKVRDGKAIEFDIQSLTNYKHSILSSDRQTTFQIFAQNSRARSLLVVPVDSSVYTSAQQISGSGTYMIKGTSYAVNNTTSKDPDDVALSNNRSQYTGVVDELSSIQYTLDGMRIPSREISTKKIATKRSLDAFHLFELEKTLDAAGIPPKSFTEFLNNFCFGRSFGAGSQKGVMDLRGKDLAVILKYQTATQPSVGKLFNSYIFHIRRLVLRDGGVDVVA